MLVRLTPPCTPTMSPTSITAFRSLRAVLPEMQTFLRVRCMVRAGALDAAVHAHDVAHVHQRLQVAARRPAHCTKMYFARSALHGAS